tara:strand:- start:2510 stop:2722 length:213 start_codon:yes stop_codon:yes gene_type:complete
MIAELRALSIFYSDPNKGIDRHATVKVSGDFDYIVDMYYEKNLIHSQVINDHTLCYAEDCAENWVIGVIK